MSKVIKNKKAVAVIVTCMDLLAMLLVYLVFFADDERILTVEDRRVEAAVVQGNHIYFVYGVSAGSRGGSDFFDWRITVNRTTY